MFRAARVVLQALQTARIIASLPVVKSLGTDIEVTAGETGIMTM